MKTNHKSLFVLFGILIMATALAALPLRTQKNSAEVGLQKNDDGQVPVIDFVNADAPTKQKARKRGLSVDNKPVAELPAAAQPLPLSGHLWWGMPALPVVQSNAVVLGEITGRRAVLTDDKLGIYSEFSIKLVKVFKDDQGMLNVGGSVEASRLGGAVRFPSGKIQRYTVSRQGYPELGNQYVLFLQRDEAGDFSIITGYNVSSPGVTPLDGDALQPKGDLQFGIYRGVARDAFLNDLKDAVLPASGRGAHVNRTVVAF
ncbi:MAG TPA: hypothetical protein VGO68_16885 [Pyrinomonadaceae bacterium]|nr:hypothetical protein [Pyrinomonadaceae bacterium]